MEYIYKMPKFVSCKPKEDREQYQCNIFTGRWIQKQGKLAQLIIHKEKGTNKQCKNKLKDGYMCNPMTGRPIKMGGPTHRTLNRMNALKPAWQIGQTVLYDDPDRPQPIEVTFQGNVISYLLYELKQGESVEPIINTYQINPSDLTTDTYDLDRLKKESCLLDGLPLDQCRSNLLCVVKDKTCQFNVI